MWKVSFFPFIIHFRRRLKRVTSQKLPQINKKVRCPQLPKVGQQSGEGDNDDPFTQNLLSFTLREEYLAQSGKHFETCSPFQGNTTHIM